MISRRFRVIFIHIPKAAGQSIESLFVLREGLTWETRGRLLLRLNTDRTQGPERLAHLFADEYVGLSHVSAETFSQFFKFAVVRDPYERAASEYRYRYAPRGVPEAEFLTVAPDPESDEGRHLAPQCRYLFDSDGRLLVDEVLRFENLASEFAALSVRIFGEPLALPYRNVSPKIPVEFGASGRDLIAARYASDFDTFGYPR